MIRSGFKRPVYARPALPASRPVRATALQSSNAINCIAINVAFKGEKRGMGCKIGEPVAQWNAIQALNNSSLFGNDCMSTSILAPVRAQWFDLRFTQSAGKIQCECEVCLRPMWLPPSKVSKYVTCGAECSSKRYAAMGGSVRHDAVQGKAKRAWTCEGCGTAKLGGKADKKFCNAVCLSAFRAKKSEALEKARTRNCKKCAEAFVVKKSQIDSGHGIYCTHQCAVDDGAHSALQSIETREIAANRRRASIAANGTKHGRGEKNASWKGGPLVALKRNLERSRKYRQEYRARNPDKVREFSRKRRKLITGPLPRGTVKRIGDSQRWLCVVCASCIKDRYHMDHILPLAKGGLHKPVNIQLLCPTCNVRKSAKHPIDFMQEQGFLL